MAITNIPRSFQYWAAITATPPDFNLDAGWYGMTLHNVGAVAVTLQKLLPDGVTYVIVATPATTDSYTNLILPAGQYQLSMTGGTSITGEIALISRGGRS